MRAEILPYARSVGNARAEILSNAGAEILPSIWAEILQADVQPQVAIIACPSNP